MFVSTYSGTKVEYAIVLIVLLLSGNNVLMYSTHKEALIILGFLILLGCYLLLRKPPIGLADITVFAIFLSIMGIQGLLFSFFPLATVAGVCLRLGIGFLAVRIVADFPRVYVNVLLATCLVSLVFYFPEQAFSAAGKDYSRLFDPFISYLTDLSGACCDRHIAIYNFEDQREVHSNAGFFWESAAFAGYLLLAIAFLGLTKEAYSPRKYLTRLTILLATLVTTFSTTGLLAAPFALATHYRRSDKAASIPLQLGFLALAIAMLPIFAFGLMKAWNLEFMGDKIEEQYERAESGLESERWQKNRIGNLLYDWQYIQERPVLGWGIHEKTLFAKRPQDVTVATGLGNGLSGFTKKFGFVGLVTFSVFLGWGFYRISSGRLLISAAAVATMLLSLNGEQFLNFPLFLGLMFLDKKPKKADEGKNESQVTSLARLSEGSGSVSLSQPTLSKAGAVAGKDD
jgi:hypothetical protein